MKHLIIGTAGHVNHGKTALVKAMTGVDTDRLKEEKERGISIELGFTALKLPGGPKYGIVDVPGNERFIKNMLAGAGGFDLVLLVVAADEGVMPQTREHLDIIQLLQVKKGVIVLTKADLVDEEWVDLVKEEVRDFLKGTVLEDAPLVTVSAVAGQGIDNLLELLERVAEDTPAKTTAGPPRLPVDRVFSVTGFGTVVTGTLVAGEIRVGDSVEVQPQGLITRVRSLQSHGEKVEFVVAGQRVAANLAGLEVEQISRGSVVAGVNSLKSSYHLDVHLSLLKSAAKPLKNRARVRFYLGSGQALGRVVLLDREELEPGAMAFAQIVMEDRTVAVKGNRFVIRSYSPMRTIGGGVVIDPAPERRHKRFRSEVLKALETWERGTPAEILEQYLRGNPVLPELADAAAGTGLQVSETEELAQQLALQGKVKIVPGDGKAYLMLTEVYRRMAGELQQMLESYHREYPLREGYPKEELRYRKFPVLNNKAFQFLIETMENDQLVRCTAQAVASRSFVSEPGPEMNLIIDKIRKELAEASFQPPAWSELTAAAGLSKSAGSELLRYLLRTGELKKVGENLYFLDETLNTASRVIAGFLHQKGEMTIGELRDLLQTSRKYALPLLGYFDKERITRRLGDKRLPGKALG
ncbi:MAG: Selenocysteine-specific elongation factor [Pelotomaculum sp. PtaB.Bin013]|uniref:Selenocysteine-specific elongation factor n=1 Tax=Pelotomaculum isophthalicicum JI TaxID=947010 RepID=A0A9X4H7R4_9FIRM|nr:selenocysteine-specific translation elongation factor [Pelotomaculum isophthalicicum]MDF9409959.1 selenocysteine-specific translation elongation factor [Pelotomaculum isophthalicicum JI]OPX89414.1 MAG: Selenocysteine-specific elongation factor [Pelotomaculum sp. PtaB.Bin013]